MHVKILRSNRQTRQAVKMENRLFLELQTGSKGLFRAIMADSEKAEPWRPRPLPQPFQRPPARGDEWGLKGASCSAPVATPPVRKPTPPQPFQLEHEPLQFEPRQSSHAPASDKAPLFEIGRTFVQVRCFCSSKLRVWVVSILSLRSEPWPIAMPSDGTTIHTDTRAFWRPQRPCRLTAGATQRGTVTQRPLV